MSLPTPRRLLLPATLVVLAVSAAPSTALAAPGVAAVTAMLVFATPISDKYAALGGSSGFLGTATISEQTAPDGVGKYRHYQGGSIYWSPTTGAHEVHGLIRNRWAELSWEKGWLGYPMSDEIDTYDSEGRVSKFEGGELIWRKATNAVSDVKSTDLVVDLPTKQGEPWVIIQANAPTTGSHQGPWVYCYDMIWNNDQPKTKGRELVSSASARVVLVEDGNTGSGQSNVIVQRLGTGRYASTLHIQQGSWGAINDVEGDINFLPQALPWTMRPVPASGAVMAKTGDVGAATGAFHIHYCITTAPDRDAAKPFESVPFAFRNYDVSNDGGQTWKAVATGVPKNGQWVRRNGAGGAAKITAGVDVLNFGDVQATVNLPVGATAAVGGTVRISALSAWGEPLASTTIAVTAATVNGPYKHTFTKVPNYKGVKLTATYEGQITPSASSVAGESASFDVKANQSKSGTVAMTATSLH